MSAWFVLSALGLSPVIPGTDVMPLGSPLFPRATVKMPGGKLGLSAPAAARKRPYVQGLRLNGHRWSRNWLHLSKLNRGGRLDWKLGSSPGRWGRGSHSAPPSFSDR